MSNTIVMGTSADDSIDSSGDFVSINAGEGNNYISSGYGKNVSIISGAGNDTIIDATYGMGAIGGNNININSGAGNDSISNYGDNVTINAGAGDDSIYNSTGYLGDYVLKVSVNGGAGNDYITYSENSAHATTNGGVGNDTIRLFIKNGVNTRDFNRRMKRRQKNILTAKYKHIKIEFSAGVVGNKIVLS